jgi:hypothetical protein
LRLDHAGAQRVHASDEGIAAGGAALHGVVFHVLSALVPDAVDVGRFPGPQAFMVDARLHPADVVAHDEEDVGFCRRRLGLRLHRADQPRHDGDKPGDHTAEYPREGSVDHHVPPPVDPETTHARFIGRVTAPPDQVADDPEG